VQDIEELRSLPLRPEDRAPGCDWNLSTWQMEVSLAQVFDRPL
jgi:hypothetical protein